MNVLEEVIPPVSAETESCSLDNYLVLPDHTNDERIAAARRLLGTSTILLGHHYQRDEVIRFADFTGDSYKLSKAASETEAQYIVFCGVHFMAESADVLAHDGQQVILPDLNAGCSMADMAEIGQVEECWETLHKSGAHEGEIVPLTYMNSSAAIKAFCGERGGLVCTSSNARKAFEWAFARGEKILFLPDQHLGRNTGHAMGIPLNEMVVYDPWQIGGGITPETACARRASSFGRVTAPSTSVSCRSTSTRSARSIPAFRSSCIRSAALKFARRPTRLGSTERLIKIVQEAPEGTSFAIGTEIHLVNRLAKQFAPLGKRIVTLDDTGCLCTTMYRISPGHLAWALENLVEGRVVNRIQVRDDVKYWARVALDRMLEVRA